MADRSDRDGGGGGAYAADALDDGLRLEKTVRTEVVLPRALEVGLRLYRPQFFSNRLDCALPLRTENRAEKKPNFAEEAVLKSISALCTECCRHFGPVVREGVRNVRSRLPDRMDDLAENIWIAMMAQNFHYFLVPRATVGEERAGAFDDGGRTSRGGGGGGGERKTDDVWDGLVAAAARHDEESGFEGPESLEGRFSWGQFVMYLMTMGLHMHECFRRRRRLMLLQQQQQQQQKKKKENRSVGVRLEDPAGDDDDDDDDDENDSTAAGAAATAEITRKIYSNEQRLFRFAAQKATEAFLRDRVEKKMDPNLGWRGVVRYDFDRIASSETNFSKWFDDGLKKFA